LPIPLKPASLNHNQYFVPAQLPGNLYSQGAVAISFDRHQLRGTEGLPLPGHHRNSITAA